MNDLRVSADQIRLKVMRLLQDLSEARAHEKTLADEIAVLKETIEFQKNTIRQLEETNKMLKIAESLSVSNSDVRDLKKKVNAYIVEIDECIKLLSER